MKNRIGYTELSMLLLGILVATIIILLIWFNPTGNEDLDTHGASSHWLLPSGKILIEKVIEVLSI